MIVFASDYYNLYLLFLNKHFCFQDLIIEYIVTPYILYNIFIYMLFKITFKNNSRFSIICF